MIARRIRRTGPQSGSFVTRRYGELLLDSNHVAEYDEA
jgi:hypothetical protein